MDQISEVMTENRIFVIVEKCRHSELLLYQCSCVLSTIAVLDAYWLQKTGKIEGSQKHKENELLFIVKILIILT